ncbi:protein zer-1 homolog [Megachile rotundata]|uniref:protein zer-1 homolog n=1 Tax=Megachile rotundata TaxID=143995 RepID=UPI000258E035|nr:PREDICTED: protein zer-1 homolog [Megachile rotundata]
MADLDDLFHLDQYVGPESLAELCFQVICKNLDIISTKDRRGYRNLLKGLILPREICDKLIKYVLRNDPREEHDYFITIFKNVLLTKLKRVRIVRSTITDQSVQILTNHKLVELELTDCPHLTECSIEYINANAECLQSLTCHGNSTLLQNGHKVYQKRGYVFKLPNLRSLALKCVTLSASEYNILLAGLTNLKNLDLSNSINVNDFEFYHLIPNLVSLVLYNVYITPEGLANICNLKNLRHLDISKSNPDRHIYENPNTVLADLVNGLPQLTSLDISGTNLAGVQIMNCGIQAVKYSYYSEFDDATNDLCDIPGLASRINRPLQFLGLYETSDGACRRRNIPAKLIAGNANEDQILLAAHVCMNNKQDLLKQVLNDLYHVHRYENCHRMDQALCAILEAMEKHPLQNLIQISGSATLFYIVKMKEKGELEQRLKERIVRTLLVGMSNHRNEETMMRNGCLTLCQFQLPQDVMSNYKALVELLLHSAKHAAQESYVQRIGIFLLNTLACRVTGREKRLLGSLGCIKTMLELIKYRVESRRFDDVLEVAWSTMWNVTDETPINCQRFFDENGMVLFLRCVEQYPQQEELLKNMMGLLGNVAEVEHLRVHLMQQQYMNVFVNLLLTVGDGIEVPYNAVGILAHIASDGSEAWTIEKPSRNEVLELMVEAIERWDISSERNINYRSFLPLLRLLDIYHTPQCQHWAVWALANLTTVYPHKYCILVMREDGLEKLDTLTSDPRPYERIKKLAHIVVENCCRYTLDISSNTSDMNARSLIDGDYNLDD